MNLTEAYLSVYTRPEFDQELYENLLEICFSQELFETVEECQYFSEQLVLEDLSIGFLEDIVETYDLDISEYLQESNIFEDYSAAARAIINALSKSGRLKAGLEQGAALGKKSVEGALNYIKGAAASQSIRSARAARPTVEFQRPGKYLDMLKAKRPEQGRLFNTQNKPYNFSSRSGTAWTGARATDPIRPNVKPTELLPKPIRPAAPGQGTLNLNGRLPYRDPGLTNTIRATGPVGNFPGLEKYKPTPKFNDSVSAINNARIKALGASTAGLGYVAASSSGILTPKSNTPSKQTQTNVYNTMDPDGKIRSRKKVGPAKVGTESENFDSSFKLARQSGKSEFDWKGKKYTTKIAGESVDNFDIIMDHLITEGYVNTLDEALIMMSALDENAIGKIIGQSIKSVIKKRGSQLSKIKLPPKMDPLEFVKNKIKRQSGASSILGTPEQKAATAARQAEFKANPPVKLKPKNPYPGDVYSKSDFGIRGYRSGD